MTGWMKKSFSAEGVTEWPPGPRLAEVTERFRSGGAVVLLLDVSGSMTYTDGDGVTNLERAVRGCESFIDEAIDGGYQTGLVLWSHDVQATAAPSFDPSTARARLAAAGGYGGGTNVFPALAEAGRMLMQLDVDDRVIAVFGDGDLGPREREAVALSRSLAAQGVRIITLGLGSQSAEALSVIATDETPTATASSTTLSSDIHRMAVGIVARQHRT
ncbi:hypothetical protein NS220_17695 [Microbacterium testaceum]|uniref:VWFA domain-containing protein n=1 Tax=Microbacterium testaceum TaxID=2033 RepID=A0A147ET86_MICTE|nr:vWA domain-containing protein [Microbacterium testaceum]KTR87523.1 hypothetical protein NS220_17695 [Microbacterium testaceum]